MYTMSYSLTRTADKTAFDIPCTFAKIKFLLKNFVTHVSCTLIQIGKEHSGFNINLAKPFFMLKFYYTVM